MKLIKIFLIFILAVFVLVNFQSYAFAGENVEEIIKDTSSIKKVVFLETSINISHYEAREFLVKQIDFMLKSYLLSRSYAIFNSNSMGQFNEFIKQHPNWEFFILSTDIKLIYQIKANRDYANIFNIFVPKYREYTQYIYDKKFYVQAVIINSLFHYSNELILEKSQNEPLFFMEKIDDSFEQIIISNSDSSNIDTPILNWIRDKVIERLVSNLNKIFN